MTLTFISHHFPHPSKLCSLATQTYSWFSKHMTLFCTLMCCVCWSSTWNSLCFPTALNICFSFKAWIKSHFCEDFLLKLSFFSLKYHILCIALLENSQFVELPDRNILECVCQKETSFFCLCISHTWRVINTQNAYSLNGQEKGTKQEVHIGQNTLNTTLDWSLQLRHMGSVPNNFRKQILLRDYFWNVWGIFLVVTMGSFSAEVQGCPVIWRILDF